jgi:hypothetical protein
MTPDAVLLERYELTCSYTPTGRPRDEACLYGYTLHTTVDRAQSTSTLRRPKDQVTSTLDLLRCRVGHCKEASKQYHHISWGWILVKSDMEE